MDGSTESINNSHLCPLPAVEGRGVAVGVEAEIVGVQRRHCDGKLHARPLFGIFGGSIVYRIREALKPAGGNAQSPLVEVSGALAVANAAEATVVAQVRAAGEHRQRRYVVLQVHDVEVTNVAPPGQPGHHPVHGGRVYPRLAGDTAHPVMVPAEVADAGVLKLRQSVDYGAMR
jgi:hypothetical protein